MSVSATNPIFAKIESHAFQSLGSKRQMSSNLYVDRRVLNPGEQVGPPSQHVVIDRASVLVFADDQPGAGFGHPCRYLLYDAETDRLYREVSAQFPPYAKDPETYAAFHAPILTSATSISFHIPEALRCPLPFPAEARYAILFSGMSWQRNLNNHEFCYRMLIDRYGFKAADIFVLRYDGTLNSIDGPAMVWPGDGSAYRIKVHGQGTRTALQGVLGLLAAKLKPGDLLFLHTENEAGTGAQAFFAEYPNWGAYYAPDFASDLGTLPKFRSLIALMGQCYAGGFSNAVLTGSTATDTSVACATSPGGSVWSTADGHFVQFGCDWISAQMGHNPYGAPLAFDPDTDGDGMIAAEEAFAYASAVRNIMDLPNFHESSEAGGDIALARRYDYWPLWCWLIRPVLARHYRPDPEYYATVAALVPRLYDLVVPTIDRVAGQLRAELGPKVRSAIQAAFQG
jgi:hypothetical protein